MKYPYTKIQVSDVKEVYSILCIFGYLSIQDIQLFITRLKMSKYNDLVEVTINDIGDFGHMSFYRKGGLSPNLEGSRYYVPDKFKFLKIAAKLYKYEEF